MKGEVNHQENKTQERSSWIKNVNTAFFAIAQRGVRVLDSMLGVKGDYSIDDNKENPEQLTLASEASKVVLNLPSPEVKPTLTHSNQASLPSPEPVLQLTNNQAPSEKKIISNPSSFYVYTGEVDRGFTMFAPEFSDYDRELALHNAGQSNKVNTQTQEQGRQSQLLAISQEKINTFSREFESQANIEDYNRLQLRFELTISQFKHTFPIDSAIWESHNIADVAIILAALTKLNTSITKIQSEIQELQSVVSEQLEQLMLVHTTKDWSQIIQLNKQLLDIKNFEQLMQDRIFQQEYAIKQLQQRLVGAVINKTYTPKPQFANV